MSQIHSEIREAHVKELLSAYLDTKHGTPNTKLIKGLTKLDKELRKEAGRGSKERGLWLRFFKNDTLATTIRDIDRTTGGFRGNQNYIHMVECMEEAIKENSGLELHFS